MRCGVGILGPRNRDGQREANATQLQSSRRFMAFPQSVFLLVPADSVEGPHDILMTGQVSGAGYSAASVSASISSVAK